MSNADTELDTKPRRGRAMQAGDPYPEVRPVQSEHAARPTGARLRRANPTLFSDIVLSAPVSGFEAVRSIREGFPAGMLKAASSFFRVPDARILNVARIPVSTAARLEKNDAKIDSAATERIFRLAAVTRMAIDVFEDEENAIEWMRQPNRALANAAPLDMMDTEPGAVSVRQILNAIASGGVA